MCITRGFGGLGAGVHPTCPPAHRPIRGFGGLGAGVHHQSSVLCRVQGTDPGLSVQAAQWVMRVAVISLLGWLGVSCMHVRMNAHTCMHVRTHAHTCIYVCTPPSFF